MANWVYTFYTIIGEEKEIKKLYDLMSKVEQVNVFDNQVRLLEDLLIEIGGDVKGVPCNGWFSI